MCGIVAIMNIDQQPGNVNIARAMSQKIAHRGPDGEGHWAKHNIAFGHRRLSIIDLTDGGSQPMQTPDGRFTITYNGEIYNFIDLRLELQALGERFVSQCDTEVVLRAVSRWGLQEAVARFNGIFAFVCYDAVDRQLLIARDRYGIKPLYVAKLADSILFASEVKAFAAHPDFQMKLDAEGLVEYFTFQNFISARTLFRNVSMFPAGHVATVNCSSDRDITPKEYWDFRFIEPAKTSSAAELAKELGFLFEQAVSRQLLSDVEVSCYLSGGMDSGSITAVASKLLPTLRTFTCGFDLTSASGVELNFDERRLAEQMSYLFKTEHYEVVLKAGDMERAMSQLSYHLDEPRVGQSYPNYYVAGLASKFGKVVLGGTGGDELFGGYPWRYYTVAGARNLGEFTDRYFSFWQRLLPAKSIEAVFAPVWQDVKHVDLRSLFEDVLKKHPVDFAHPSASLNLALYFEAKTFLHGLLVVEDKLSMAHGLESRVPFLDNDLVDFAMRLPASAKVRDLHGESELNARSRNLGTEAIRQFQKTNDGKLLLRQMMAGLLPSHIVEAQKQGFSAPDASWFRGESIDYVKSNLSHSEAPIYKYMARDKLEPMLASHFEGRENQRLLIWSLLGVNEAIERHQL